MNNDQNNIHPPRQNFRIWQQNINNSLNATHTLLNTISPNFTDIIALQEPYWDSLTNTRSNSKWYVVYPPGARNKKEKKSRSIMLVSKAISTNTWEQIHVEDLDVTAIKIVFPDSALQLAIFNIYLDQSHSEALKSLETAAKDIRETDRRRNTNTLILWLGDFNRHSPLWDEARNHHLFTRANLDAAELLTRATAKLNMHMLLPPSIPTLLATRTKNETRPDNVFGSKEIRGRLTRCQVYADSTPPCTDHYPILTEIDTRPVKAPTEDRYNYAEADWDEIHKELKTRLNENGPPKELESIAELQEEFERINRHIEETVSKHTPKSKPWPMRHRWWNDNLSNLHKELRRLQRLSKRHRQNPFHEAHELSRTAARTLTETISKAKSDHWYNYLDDMALWQNEGKIWKANKSYIKNAGNDSASTRVPTMMDNTPGAQPTHADNNAKCDLFKTAFFIPPPTTMPDFDESYPLSAFDMPIITDDLISRVISRSSPKKVPGPSGITNEVLKENSDILTPFLGPIFRGTFKHEWYPEKWKTSKTIVLRKPKRPDYRLAKAYRPIALMDGISKACASCVMDILVEKSERLQLLPSEQFGGRPGRTTTDALHLLTSRIKNAWRKGKVVSVLYLDIKSAFPSVVPEILTHDLRRKGIPVELTNWIYRKLSNRKTTLHFDDYSSPAIDISSGLDQGCPSSVVLHSFANAFIPETLREEDDEYCSLFVDDTCVIAEGDSFEECHEHLNDIMTRPAGILDEARKRNIEFEISKSDIQDFSRKRIRTTINGKTRMIPMPRPPAVINGNTLSPVKTKIFLGVEIDEELRFKEHGTLALKKGMAWANKFTRLSNTSTGMPPICARQLYISVAIPQMLYAADLFCHPTTRFSSEGEKIRKYPAITHRLARVQRMIATQALGAMRSTASDTLNAHANLLPFPLLVDKTVASAAVRYATRPPSHPLFPHVRRAARRLVKKHASPLHQILHAYDIKPTEIEKVNSYRKIAHPTWNSPISTSIPKDKTKAAERVKKCRNKFRIFTDGSMTDGGVGAAAVLERKSARTRKYEVYKSIIFHLGSDQEHTVYDAELVGTILGLHLAKFIPHTLRIDLFLDNQAVIKAIPKADNHPGQYLLDEIHEQADRKSVV